MITTDKRLAAVPMVMMPSKKNPSHQYLREVWLILTESQVLDKGMISISNKFKTSLNILHDDVDWKIKITFLFAKNTSLISFFQSPNQFSNTIPASHFIGWCLCLFWNRAAEQNLGELLEERNFRIESVLIKRSKRERKFVLLKHLIFHFYPTSI